MYTVVKPITAVVGPGIYDTRITDDRFSSILAKARNNYSAPKVRVFKVAKSYTTTIIIDEKHVPKCTQQQCLGYHEDDGTVVARLKDVRVHNGAFATEQDYQFVGIQEQAEFRVAPGKTLVFEIQHNEDGVITKSVFFKLNDGGLSVDEKSLLTK